MILRNCYLVAMWMLLSGSATALVDPLEADIPEQDWMVNVLVKGYRSPYYAQFCKGSLIHPYWVLSSAACLIDPRNILTRAVGPDAAQYAVDLGNLGGLYKVEERRISADGTAMLLRLNRPATRSPIRLLYSAPADLRGVQLRIFNRESSLGLGHGLYNPKGRLTVTCQVDGAQFFANGRMCYVLSAINYESRQLMARGRPVDPRSGNAPRHPLNPLVTLNTNGNRLYLDFSEQDAYPCHEDMGAPIVATQGGQLVQVGLVVAVGMATGVPLCNDSFANYLTTLDGLQEFIEGAIASGEFSRQCPARPELKFERLSGNRVRFYWEEIHAAQGYNALFTRRLGYAPIERVDLGNLHDLAVSLDSGTTYTLAVQAYNADCTSLLSPTVTVAMP